MNDPEFAKMLEEFERELENLSPEERRQFDEMVDEFARVIQDMPEEEFNQLLQDINTDFAMAEEAVPYEAMPRETAVAPVVQLTVPDEIKKLAETLQNIRTYLSLFLVKIQIAPEFSLKIDKWIQQGKVENAPQGYTWDQCNYDIEKFLALVSNLLETDKHMNPIFLFEIHKDLPLEDMLNTFAELLTIVPSIDIVEFGFKQEKEVSAQVRDVISHVCELFFKQDVITKLDLIFKAHQKEIETKQGAAGKKVEPAPFASLSTQAVSAEPSYRSDFYDEEPYGFYDEDLYNDYYPSSRYPEYQYGGDTAGSQNEKKEKEGEQGKKASQSQSSSSEKGQKKDKKEEKKSIKSVSSDLQKQLSEIVSLTRTTNIEQFEKYLENSEIQFTMQNTLKNAEKLVEKTADAAETGSTLTALIDKEKKPEKTIQDIQNKLVNDIGELNAFNDQLSKLILESTSYSLEKRFAYFGDVDVLNDIKKTNAKTAKELEANQEQFVSITKLSKNFNKLLDTLKPFIKEEKEEEVKLEETEEVKGVEETEVTSPEATEQLQQEPSSINIEGIYDQPGEETEMITAKKQED